MKPYEAGRVLALGLSALSVLFVLAAGCSGTGSQPPEAQEQSGSPPFTPTETISKGTAIYVRLQQSISSSSAEPGQSFTAVLDDPLMLNGRVVAPQGAAVNGRVVAARKSGRLHDAGYLRLALSTVTIDGKAVPVQTSSVFVKGGTYRNHTLSYVGGATGGSKNALMGSIVGDAGGAPTAYVNDGKEVGFAAESRVGFRLMEALNIGEKSASLPSTLPK
jgi:hypothetical protein